MTTPSPAPLPAWSAWLDDISRKLSEARGDELTQILLDISERIRFLTESVQHMHTKLPPADQVELQNALTRFFEALDLKSNKTEFLMGYHQKLLSALADAIQKQNNQSVGLRYSAKANMAPLLNDSRSHAINKTA